MNFFDFHHHKVKEKGIYNLAPFEKPTEHYFSVGIHPKDINDDWEDTFLWIKEFSTMENCIAIGECGLDAFVEADIRTQEAVFRKHILWANEIQKPVIIHCVRRFQELIAIKKSANTPLIVHGFNKKKIVADELLKHGFYMSFGKSLLQQLSLQQTVMDFPLEKMFLETDDADFDIKLLYEKVSEIKQIPLEEVENQILKNFENIRNE